MQLDALDVRGMAAKEVDAFGVDEVLVVTNYKTAGDIVNRK
jgi:hypothetical protein